MGGLEELGFCETWTVAWVSGNATMALIHHLAGSYPAERLGIDNTPSERAVERLPLAVKSKPLGGAEVLAGRT